MSVRRWTDEEIKILKEKYPKQGSDIEELDRTRGTIRVKAGELNIKFNSSKVEVKCDYCGRSLKIYPSQLKRSKYHFCNQTCQYRWMKDNNPMKKPEVKIKLSGKNHWTYGKGRPKMKGKNNPMYGKHHTEEALKKIKKASIERLKNPETLKKILCISKPSGLEKGLNKIIQENFPGEFVYNGDFRRGISIGGKVPDWWNCNGKKLVIEAFGRYWHDPRINPKVTKERTEEGTKNHYKKYGIKCLVIWDYEVKKTTENIIVDKIKNFMGGEKVGS